MKAGDTFITTKKGEKVDSHLWLVVSDPDAENRVVTVTLTTYRSGKERACVLNRGDHSFVAHETVVSYENAQIVDCGALDSMVHHGFMRPHDPLSPALLARVRKGAWESEDLPIGAREMLLEQGVI